MKKLKVKTEEKTCSNCGKVYPATSEYFGKDKARKNGLQSWCKECKKNEGKIRHMKDKANGTSKAYYQEHRLRHILSGIKKRGYPNLTEEQLQFIVDNFKNDIGISICPYCGREMVEDEMMQFDHFIPCSEGNERTNILTNLIPSCRYCNRSKNNEEFSYWYRNQLFYNKNREKELINYVKRNRLIPFFNTKQLEITGWND